MNSICECLQIAFTELQEVHCICCLEYSWALQIPGKVPENSILIKNLKIHLRISKLLDKPTLRNWAMMLVEEGQRITLTHWMKIHFTEAQGQPQCFLPSSCIHCSAWEVLSNHTPAEVPEEQNHLKPQNKISSLPHSKTPMLNRAWVTLWVTTITQLQQLQWHTQVHCFLCTKEACALLVPAAHKLLVSTLLFPSKFLLLPR